MSDVLTKLGFTDGCTYVFNADSTYTSTVKVVQLVVLILIMPTQKN